MAFAFYLFRRAVAIVLGAALTGYSAWASWTHQGDLIGPLAAVSAALLLAFCEYAWRDGQRFMACALVVLGLAAATISGSIVLDRVSHTREARDHKARSANLPRQEAHKALAEAQQALKTAEAEASDVCGSKRGSTCKGLEQREEAAGNASRRPAPSWLALVLKPSSIPRQACSGLTRTLSDWSCCSACPCGSN